MTTARDLSIIVLDARDAAVERGDLSLALAAAEAVDLLAGGVIALAGDRIEPLARGPVGDRLLTQAADAVRREAPYETVGDWLWRRGRGLADAYLGALEAEGEVTREERRRWGLFRTVEPVLADSAARRRALSRREADEPVLAALAEAVGIGTAAAGDPQEGTPETPQVTDPDRAAVLDALADALGELAQERRRRAHRIQDAAADNYRRGY